MHHLDISRFRCVLFLFCTFLLIHDINPITREEDLFVSPFMTSKSIDKNFPFREAFPLCEQSTPRMQLRKRKREKVKIKINQCSILLSSGEMLTSASAEASKGQ